MKLWTLATFCAASLLILSGCTGTNPKPKKEQVIDNTLPLVELTPSGTLSTMKTIALEWKSIEDKRVRGIYIYRAALDTEKSGGDDYYATVNNRFSTHFVDTDIEPESRYSYYFKTYSNDAESMPSQTTTITSLPIMDSVSWIHSVGGMPRSAKIIWRPHSNQKVKAYLLQRRTLKSESWDNIKTVKGRLNVEYIDNDLKDKFTYKYRIKALTYDDITSKPSKEVTVITKALPSQITNITATKNLPKKIEIKWAKSNDADFLHYNLYRSKDVDSGYKIIKQLKKDFYIDLIENDGERYFYRVSVIDKDDLESKYESTSAMGTSLNRPSAPALVEAKLVGSNIEIKWNKADPRATSYTVSKRYKRSMFDESKEDFEGIKGTEFIDNEIMAGLTYYYRVYGVDKNFIKSEPSIEVEIETAIDNPNLGKNTPIKDEQTSIIVDAPVVETVNKDVVIINNDFN